MATNDVRAEDDGRTHVNVYSQGKTELGRLLSNFAHAPFKLDGLEFASVEGFWFWLKTGRDEVRGLHGSTAKKVGGSLPPIRSEPSWDELKRAYLAKLAAHPRIKAMLAANRLPFAHYYVFNGAKVRADKYLWTVNLWEEVAAELRGEYQLGPGETL